MYADDILLLARHFTHCKFWCLPVSQCLVNWILLSGKVFVSGLVLGAILVVRQFYCQTVLNCNGSVDNVRYVGACVARSTHFSCSFDNAKKSFYRSFNAIFGKIGRIASENVVKQLIKSKCVLVLLLSLIHI